MAARNVKKGVHTAGALMLAATVDDAGLVEMLLAAGAEVGAAADVWFTV